VVELAVVGGSGFEGYRHLIDDAPLPNQMQEGGRGRVGHFGRSSVGHGFSLVFSVLALG